jgi:hypothetical protein
MCKVARESERGLRGCVTIRIAYVRYIIRARTIRTAVPPRAFLHHIAWPVVVLYAAVRLVKAKTLYSGLKAKLGQIFALRHRSK